MSMEVFMRMHVSSPAVPKCICHAMYAQRVTFILIHKVVCRTQKEQVQDRGIGLFMIGQNLLTSLGLITEFLVGSQIA
jgi:hypothetical protein